MEPSPGQVTVQRKATIVKVTEKRVMASPGPSSRKTGTPSADYAVDTVVHRRKATIIKVTEHRESYSPAKARCSHPEYRHSYTEGLFQNNSTWSQGNPPKSNVAPSQHQVTNNNSTVAPHAMTADPEKNGTVHRSTLSLFLSNPPAIAAPASSEVPSKAVGRRPDRPHRPQSWYGNAIGHTEPCKETVTQPVARKWSSGLPQQTNINPVNPSSGFIGREKAATEPGQRLTDTLKPSGGDKGEKDIMLLRPEDTKRSLTLIKAPDPRSSQSPDEVLALNAAAIIANIKLQRRLGKKTTPNGDLERDSAASPPGNMVTDGGKCMKSPPDQSQGQRRSPAGFVPLSPGTERSDEPVSLQQALKRSRPDFISRSQGRVRRLERKARERRELSDSVGLRPDAAFGQRRAHGAQSAALNDHPFRPRDRPTNWKDMQSRTKQTAAEMKRKKDEEKKREICLSNRQRVELFKKKLLAQVLQKSNN
ncbi:(E2-independent) E3 ubiquitin-conjugating enzyme FATS [Salarias fasciatus]|uniref:(E2-independent) E3 ubiquitin-conjugating enzyme FATS n=1 Tax=Salarias fasciatus TaxID=181472 RepID=UPI001176E170|nr:(E2-independent) E3 ubiquitin-conjugating enzyme FATS [Salarias fasciatus]